MVEEFRNGFKDIGEEDWREYHYSDGAVYRIESPLCVKVSQSSMGGHAHRVVSRVGEELMAHYVAPGWITITWGKKGETSPENMFWF